MQNYEIKLNVTINGDGDLIINDTKIINLNHDTKKLTTEFIIKESQSRYGYVHFPRSTGFQDVIKNGRNISIVYGDQKYDVKNYEPTPGRINGLSKFFKDNNIVENDRFEMELLADKEPLEIYMRKTT